jgi:hypothetical protein
VTPLTKNFLSPSKKNFAAGRIRWFAAVVMSSEVETSPFLTLTARDLIRSLPFAQPPAFPVYVAPSPVAPFSTPLGITKENRWRGRRF